MTAATTSAANTPEQAAFSEEPTASSAETGPVQVHRIYIKTTPQAIWDAITLPEWTERYGYGGRVQPAFRQGEPYEILANDEMQAAGMPEVVVAGEVLVADEPHKLVLLWRANWDSEPATTLTYEIQSWGDVCSLTITHDLTGAPNLAAMVGGAMERTGAGGGWAQVLSDLKTLLETGTSLYAKG
jgi:uncharacterized protein YndB with AHSA1/START domain